MKNVVVLGSTGSIGTQALEVIANNKDNFQIFALVAYSNINLIFEQIKNFKPNYAILVHNTKLKELKSLLSNHKLNFTKLIPHHEINSLIADHDVDIVICAITGFAGIKSFFTAIEHNKKILLANKEALIVAGGLFIKKFAKHNAQLIPIDSEHNAIFQALNAKPNCYPIIKQNHINDFKIILTASGGPFLNKSYVKLKNITVDNIKAHPTWKMGLKISTDSATMVNKALEFVEAVWLYGIKDIEIIINPQSIIHSIISYKDGCMIAQLSKPNMKTHIAHALGYPKRINSGVGETKIATINNLNFYPLDNKKFPAVNIIKNCLTENDSSVLCFNAINEVCVDYFLKYKLRFTDIVPTIEKLLSSQNFVNLENIEHALEENNKVRELTKNYLDSLN